MSNFIMDKLLKNENGVKKYSGKKRNDINLVGVRRHVNNTLEFILEQNVKIEKIIAVKDNYDYEIKFTQNNQSIFLDLELPNNLIVDHDEKYDIYFIIKENIYRPYLGHALELSNRERHFDTISNVDLSGYLYFSKNYKRAMLQIKKLQNLTFKNFLVRQNYIVLKFDYQDKFNDNYQIVLERWGKQIPLETKWMRGEVRGYVTDDKISDIAKGYGYTIRFKNNSESESNILYGIKIHDQSDFQIGINEENKVLPFNWEKIERIEQYSATDGKTRLHFPNGYNIEKIFLEYKERPVFKEVAVNMEYYGWIKLDIDIRRLNNVFKGLQVVYQLDQKNIFRSSNTFDEIQPIYAIPNKLNVKAEIMGSRVDFYTEAPIKIKQVLFRFKNESELYEQDVEIVDVFNFFTEIEKLEDVELIYFYYLQKGDGIEHRSVSKIEDIVVTENKL